MSIFHLYVFGFFVARRIMSQPTRPHQVPIVGEPEADEVNIFAEERDHKLRLVITVAPRS